MAVITSLRRMAAVIAATIGLAGCFQPLYGPSLSGPRTALGTIGVEPIPEHLGHQLKSELDFQLNNGTPPESPVYRLKISPKGNSVSVVADSAMSRPQVMTYVVTASYTLEEVRSGKVVTTGQATVQASFDRDIQRLATVRAQRDAEVRAATQLAEQIKVRVLSALSGLKD